MRVTFMATKRMRRLRVVGALGGLGVVSAIGITACSSSDIEKNTPKCVNAFRIACRIMVVGQLTIFQDA